MRAGNRNIKYNESLVDRIKSIRREKLKKKLEFTKEQLEKPISFWIKKDRLLNEIGKEFTIILRTRGCNWALGGTGGCSMCGYVQDANINEVKPNQIINQFNYALQNKLDEIENDKYNYVLKLFNSGSFLDENEVAQNVRSYIYNKIAKIKKIKEVVIESRIEYVSSEKLEELRDSLKKKYIEVGIGLETINDYIRNNYINKGLLYDEFQNTLQLCKEHRIGVKAYLLFKPPFLNEIGALDDCVESIKNLVNLKLNTISINPLNIQKGSFTEYLWFQNRYRPPWFYSLIKCLKKSITQDNLKSVRIISDPSGAGKKRGIHNCLKRNCNENMIKLLKNFVLNQNINFLEKPYEECGCKTIYQLQRHYC
jgi:radical SAM enzyme (TIGR01210 family)